MALSARQNPFATEHLKKIRYVPTGKSIEALLHRFDELGGRAALVAPHGHGKSTLLRALKAEFKKTGKPVISALCREGDRSIPAESLNQLKQQREEAGIFLLDGAEQLSYWNWYRFLWTLPANWQCLITTHRAGYLPTLQDCSTSAPLLDDILAQLPLGEKKIAPEHLKMLLQKHRGDVRQVLFELYDEMADGSL